MKEKNQPTKIVRGGFRANLALLISIISLIISVMAYYKTADQADFNAKVTDIQNKLERIKEDTSDRVTKIRQETTKLIDKLGVEIKRHENEIDNIEGE
jgi:peptidoglycan hydrolase CwlO-like protein